MVIVSFKTQSPIVASADTTFPTSQYYPLVGKVVRLIEDYDLVMVEDRMTGDGWVFTGIEDWMIGDDIAMVMDDRGTHDDNCDDIIVSIRYFI